MDPVTIIAGGAAAFQALKQGIAVGKDLQDMGGQLSKWAGAMADLDFVERRNQNPPWYKALGGGMRQSGILAAAALTGIKDFQKGILAKDHEKTKRLAHALKEMDVLTVT